MSMFDKIRTVIGLFAALEISRRSLAPPRPGQNLAKRWRIEWAVDASVLS